MPRDDYERNPFTPSFGVSPPLLVGRDEVLQDFTAGLDRGVGDPYRALLVTGARGSGKTVLLNRIEDLARERGWAVLSQTTRPGMLQEMVETRLPSLATSTFGDRRRSTITGANVTVMGSGSGFQRTVEDEGVRVVPDLRGQLFELADHLDREHQTGVLISLDEVHRLAEADLRVILQEVQHAFREGRQVALAAAGLPEAVSDLLNADVLTFLRRAEHYPMGAVGDADVAEALRQPINSHGREITDDALERAVKGTQGYPYLIQGVGYESWRAAREEGTITPEHVEVGVEAALRRIGRLVHEPSLATLSPVDKSFLAAMAVDDGPSRVGDIADRLATTPQYVNVYRKRLLDAEIIYSPGRGLVDFSLPYLRDYLRSHVAVETARDLAAPRVEPDSTDQNPIDTSRAEGRLHSEGRESGGPHEGQGNPRDAGPTPD